MYVVLINERRNLDNRHWVKRQTLDEAKKVASYYEGNFWQTEIVEY